MDLIVEDGNGRPDALSYASIEVADAYHLARLNQAWIGGTVDPQLKAAALVRATAFIDATYRGRFPGYPAHGRQQALEWPRIGAYVVVPDNGRSDALYYAGSRDYAWLDGVYQIPSTEIPRELVAAVCEGALRELAKPGSLSPDLKRGGAIRSVGAGSARVEYFGGAPATTTFQVIDLALRSLLMPASPYGGRVSRG